MSDKNKKAPVDTNRIILEVEDEFLDVGDEPWSYTLKDGSTKEVDLRGVLMHTIRQCPVKKAEDAERTLDILLELKAGNGHIDMRKDNFDWMLAHFKEMGTAVWKAPDTAFLCRYLRDNVKMAETAPEAEES